MSCTPVLDEVCRREHLALSELGRLLGHDSLCRTGGPQVKRLEGRAAALADLRRLLQRSKNDDAAVDLAVRRWDTTPGRGPDWDAYRDGGRAALAELGQVTTPTSQTAPTGLTTPPSLTRSTEETP